MKLSAALAAFTLVLPALAGADAREAAVAVHSSSGAAMLTDPSAGEETRTTSLSGVAARLSYATHDAWSYEVEVALARTSPVRFDGIVWNAAAAQLERAGYLSHGLAGVRLRLGAAYIPTISLAAGAQAHAATRARIVASSGEVINGPDGAIRWAPVARAGLGFEHRLDARWLVGISASATAGLTAHAGRSIEGGMYVSYAWYPSQ